MSITIRLSRIGKKNGPAYRVVVANTRDKRNGKALDLLGFYNPSENAKKVEIDKKKFEEWKSKGALVSKSVSDLIEGKYTYAKYTGKKTAEETPAA